MSRFGNWLAQLRATLGRWRVLQTLARLRTGFALLLLILIVGAAGYAWLEGLEPLRAFYSALLVVSTLGFSDFQPRSTGGIVLTIALIFSGVGTLYFLLGRFAETLIETSLGTQQERRMERHVARMRRHYIICGFGRVGRHAARELRAEQRPFVILDHDPQAIDEARELGYIALLGDATEDRVLQQVGVERANGLLVTTASDAANVFITLTARAFNHQLLIIARASTESSESKLLKAGADKVIAPEVVGGQRMAALVLRPETTELVDTLTLSQDTHSWLDELLLSADSPLCGQRLEQTRIHTATGARIIAIRRDDGTLITNPGGDVLLTAGDVLVSVGEHQQLLRLEELARATDAGSTQKEPDR